MKLNKFLITILLGSGTLVPIVLSSCSVSNSNSITNNNDNTPKEKIIAPFQNSLYDSLPGNELYFYVNDDNLTIPEYKLDDINQWQQSELNAGRKYDVSTNNNLDDIDNITFSDSFICSYFSDDVSTNSDVLFKDLNSFYTWIKKDQVEYSFYLNNEISTNKTSFAFNSFDWSFLMNPNCNVYAYLETSWYNISNVTNERLIAHIKLVAFPKRGYEWDIKRTSNNGKYNNNKFIEFSFNFPITNNI